ncbi:MAG TPA: hypothetical protein VKC56_08005 [Gallionellaceae bacterium]|nr:hypothetical protein [Gallionellaceae bacterium]
MDIDRLLTRKQLNVQEQNALTRREVLVFAQAYRAQETIYVWVRQALVESDINPEDGILVSASSVPCGGNEEMGYAQWLTSAGRFYDLEATLRLGSLALISIDSAVEVTDKISRSSHERGTGKSLGALALEVLAEMSGAN